MIQYTERFDKAIRIAAWAHDQQKQYRKGTDLPYIIHPVGVMLIASGVTSDEDVLLASLLHDVLEDVDSKIYSQDDMNRDFGQNVTDIVLGVTKNDDIKDWRQRSEAYIRHLREGSNESLIVSLADKIHNLKSILIDYDEVGDKLWDRFTTKSGADQLWWYEQILKTAIERDGPEALTSQLKDLVLKLQKIV